MAPRKEEGWKTWYPSVASHGWSIKVLRFYDNVGLLKPAWVDPSSGYRYYRIGQANHAEAIRILRSVEMPIDEIKELRANDSPDITRKLLDGHRRRLAERLAQQQRTLAFLEALIEREEGVMPYEVTVAVHSHRDSRGWRRRHCRRRTSWRSRGHHRAPRPVR